MKVFKFIGIVFFFIGLIFGVVVFVLIISNINFLKSAQESEGLVIDLIQTVSTSSSGDSSVTYKPEIEYYVNNEKYTFISSFGTNPPTYRVNDKVTVIYSPFYPSSVKIKSFFSLWFLPLLFGVFFLIFFVIGAAFLILVLKNKQKIAWLNQNGIIINAEIAAIDQNFSVSVNGKHPYQISANYLDQTKNEMYIFKSPDIWYNPQNYLAENNIKMIEVLVDPVNYGKYHISLDFLPKIK